jgi:hypothetical protein
VGECESNAKDMSMSEWKKLYQACTSATIGHHQCVRCERTITSVQIDAANRSQICPFENLGSNTLAEVLG